ncbi:MAG: MFS transporter [Oscillospiraceae bacterium]|nr:MFS transporter [Oscillospiraceae bacterium]
MKKVKEEGIVKFPEKLGFGAFSMSNNIVFNFKGLYYLTFLKMVLGIPVFWASLILTIGTVWDAINDPLIGFWCVNHRFKSGERIRPLALWFALPWALSVVLLFADFGLPQLWTIVTAIVIYIVFEALYTFLCIPYNSMAALASNYDADRRSINSFRSLGSCLGSGIGAVLVPVIVKNVFGGLKSDIYTAEDAAALLKTAVLMAVIAVAGCLIHYFTTRERVVQLDENEEHISFAETFRMLFTVKSWVANMLFILCYGITTAMMMNEINDYAAYILCDSAKATPILAFYLVVSVLTAAFIGPIDRRLGRKGTMIFAAAVQIVGKLPFLFAPLSMAAICINAVSVGMGSTAAFVMFNTNRNNVADIVEFKFRRRIDSMVATCDNLITKLAEALAVWIMGIALSLSGFNAALGVGQPAAARTAICALLGWVPGLICIAMLWFASKTDIAEEYAAEKAHFEQQNGGAGA